MLPQPSRVEKIGLEELYIYDGFFKAPDIKKYYATLKHANFTFLHASREDTVKHREWMADFSVDDFESHPLHQVAKDAALRIAKKGSLKCYDVFCNASSFGDMSFIHNDSTKANDISTLYYANSHWEPEWGGETVFFTDNLDARLAISLMPGRLIAFSGNLKHRAGIPTKICPEMRLSLSMRFEVLTNV